MSVGKMVAGGFAAAAMLLVSVVSAQAGPLDELSKFAAQASAAGGSVPNNVTGLTVAPVTKFSATGRLSESLGNGPCLNNPIAVSACSGVSCAFLSMQGSVNATALGKSNLNACFTLLPNTGGGACLGNGLGIGTITAANGNLINIAFAGSFCIADENLITITLDLGLNLNYVVEGGTGPFVTETGDGNLTVSDIIVNPTSLPYPGTGQAAMTGTLSKN